MKEIFGHFFKSSTSKIMKSSANKQFNNNNYCHENMLDNSDYHYITKIKIEEKKNDDKDDDNRNKIKNKAKKHTNIDNYHFPNSLF